MMNYIWAAIMLISIVTAFFTGKIDMVASASVQGAISGVTFILELVGVMCFWTGIMAIAERGKLIDVLSRLLRPLTRILFPDISPKSSAMNAIVMNMTANMLGMSNAATPLGLRAMVELDKLNNKRNTASNAMCMFVIINTASIQLIPATLIAIRTSAGSHAPTEVIVPIWIVSAMAVTVGVVSAKIFEKRRIHK